MSTTRSCPVLVLAFGNRGRGDDALGPLLLENLSSLPMTDIELLEAVQLQIEHTADLHERDLVLFVDASADRGRDFRFRPVRERPEASHTTHALTPGALLSIYHRVFGPPPESFLLAIGGENFGLGEPLSRPAELHLGSSVAFARDRLTRARATEWLAHVTEK